MNDPTRFSDIRSREHFPPDHTVNLAETGFEERKIEMSFRSLFVTLAALGVSTTKTLRQLTEGIRLRRGRELACCLLAFMGASAPARAQNVTFAGVQTTVGSGLFEPTGVAVDAAGNVFIADNLHSRVVKVPAGGGAQTTVGSGLSYPGGVAVDGAGDVFIADTGNNRVVEVPTGGGAQTTVGSGLRSPAGVAVDGAGNVFIADTVNSWVVEVPAGGGVQTTVGSGLSEPNGVAVDGAGDVFIADTDNSRVVEVPAGGGAQTTVGSGLTDPFGVAVDGAGNVFIADGNNNRVVKVQPVAVNFGIVNIQSSSSLALNYNVVTTTTFGATQVVTGGVPNLDFALSGGGTCTGTVSAGSSCTINATFAPLAPGARMGAAQLFDSSGDLLATTLVYGIGQGPAVAFGPGAGITVGSGLSFPGGVAVDAAGDVFIADTGNAQVVKVPAGGGPQTTVGSGLNYPASVAVDGAGNVFIADPGNNQVVKVPAGGGAQTTVGSGLSEPYGVAVDGAGDVFIADYLNSRVVKVPAGGGPQTTLGSGLSYPTAVAVDGAGYVFIADSFNRRVVEVQAGGGAQTTVGSGLNSPFGVAVDGAGDVFIADTFNNRVVEVPAGGGAQTTVGSGLNTPNGVAVDGAGNVFIADTFNNRVVKVQRSQPPSLSFAATNVGGTSSDSPQSVTAQNIGNQTLNAVTPGLVVTGPNFLQVAGSGTPTDCTSTFALTPGGSCNLSISFEPQSVGPLTSTAVFTDNALNASPSAHQSIALAGTGTQDTQTISFGTILTQTVGTPLTLTATASSGLPVTYTSSTTGVCTVSSTTATFLTGGTCTIVASQAGNADYSAATPVSQSFRVNLQAQTITFGAIPTQTVGTPLALTATASSGLPVTFTSSTTGVCTVSGTTATLIASGACTIIASQAGNGTTYAAAPPVSQSFTVNQKTQTITFTTLASQVQGTPLTLNATASSGLAVTFTSSTPTVCTVSGSTGTMLTAGTCTIVASQPGNLVYAAATPVSESFAVAAAFTITPLPNSETVFAGGIAAFVLELQSKTGFNGNITLTCSGGPAGSQCQDFPQTIRLIDGYGLAISSILCPKNTAPGTYTITFTGTSGAVVNTATATFIVKSH
jgi:sugar lactone lactonase YvrE